MELAGELDRVHARRAALAGEIEEVFLAHPFGKLLQTCQRSRLSLPRCPRVHEIPYPCAMSLHAPRTGRGSVRRGPERPARPSR